MATQAYSRFSVTALAVLIAIFYAFQHPLSKPLASRIGSSTSGVLTMALLTEIVIAAFAIAVICLSKSTRIAAFELLRIKSNYNPIMVSVVMGYISLGVYIFSLINLHYVSLAIILNTGVIWSAIIAKLARKIKYSGFFWGCSLVSVATIVVSDYLKSGMEITAFLSDLGYSAFAISIPIFFTLSQQVRDKYLPSHKPFVIVICSQLVSSLIALGVALCLYESKIWTPVSLSENVGPTMMFVTGSFSLSVIATIIIQFTLRVTGGDSGYISAFSLTTPFFAAVIGYVLYKTINMPELRSDVSDVWPIIVILPSLFLLRYANRKRYG